MSPILHRHRVFGIKYGHIQVRSDKKSHPIYEIQLGCNKVIRKLSWNDT